MHFYRILFAASISAAAAIAAAQTTATSQRPPIELTALDYIEIEQLNRKYAWAIDTCADDGFAYADLYTPDGTFIDGQTGRRWQGRERLAEAAGGNGRGCPFVRMPLSHVIVNLVIEATPDGAKGKSYLVYPGKNGQFADEKHQGHDGGYQDTYVKKPSTGGVSKSACTCSRRKFPASTPACRTSSSSRPAIPQRVSRARRCPRTACPARSLRRA